MKCDYCEIEITCQDLDTHKEYCGTRTEPCPLCGQFVMIKHLLRHEESNCTYPPVKNDVQANTNVRNPLTSNNGDDIHVDPFTFDEIQRILHKPAEVHEVTASGKFERNRGKHNIASLSDGMQPNVYFSAIIL